MSNYKFSNRMIALAELALPGEAVADIGTDHGFVPIYLLAKEMVPFAILSDLREGPLDKARGNLKRFKIAEEKFSVRLGPGMEPIKKGEVSSVIIAGMGGEMIIDILNEDISKSQSLKRLILQPRKDSALLRAWLYDNHFDIIQERLVEEDGNICEILVAEPKDGNIEREDIYLPAKMQKEELFQDFLLQYMNKLDVVIENIMKKGDEELLAPWKKRMEDAERLRKK